MKGREWTICLVLVALLMSLVVVPLVAPLAEGEARVGLLFADEGDEDDDDDDDDGKIAIYWIGRNIYYYEPQEDRDDIAQDVLDRGFTHVVNRSYTMDDSKDEWFVSRGFKVIQDITPTGDPQPMTPRYHSPYEEPVAYTEKMANLKDYLESHSDYLVGIDDDIEYYPWPTKIYKADGTERLYPRKELIANTPDDYEHRIGTEDADTSWRTFMDHPSDGYHYVPDLTIEQIEYNFPQLGTHHDEFNSRLNLGYFKPGDVQVGKLAQTFRPDQDRITRIDILVARHGGSAEFPPGDIYFYLTETTDDGLPDESKRLFAVDLRIKRTETDFDAGTDFTEIEPLSLYFDPEEHGTLDTSKTYALVLWYRGAGGWSEDRVWYVVAADNSSGYDEGASFRGWGDGNWAAFDGTDIWFKVYYPDPPEGRGLREFHEDWIDFQTDVMKWHLEEYRQILDQVNTKMGTSLELYVYSNYSMTFVDYTGRVIGNLHGDYDVRSYFTADWDKFASAGLDWAVAGWGTNDIGATLADLDGRAGLICFGQTEEEILDRWWTCNKKITLWYPSAYYKDDPGVVLPQGRSPKSIP